jgi:hypothetical protein
MEIGNTVPPVHVSDDSFPNAPKRRGRLQSVSEAGLGVIVGASRERLMCSAWRRLASAASATASDRVGCDHVF